MSDIRNFMVLQKYKRWPQALISEGKVWRRSKVKGWFEFRHGEKGLHGYSVVSKFINHPDFVGAKKVWGKKELQKLK